MKHEQLAVTFHIEDEQRCITAVVEGRERAGRALSISPEQRPAGTKFLFEHSPVGVVRSVARMMLRACDLAEAVRPTEIVTAQEDKPS